MASQYHFSMQVRRQQYHKKTLATRKEFVHQSRCGFASKDKEETKQPGKEDFKEAQEGEETKDSKSEENKKEYEDQEEEYEQTNEMK